MGVADISHGVLEQLGLGPEQLDREVRLMLAARLYERGLASTGKAAELVGLPRALVLSRLSSFGVSLVEMSPDELREEMQNAGRDGQ